MMKRLLAVLVGIALLTMVGVSAVQASETFTTPLMFRYQRGLTMSQTTVNAFDSLSSAMILPTTAALITLPLQDTTTAVDTRLWSYHGPYGANWYTAAKAYSVADTLFAFTLFTQTSNRAAVATLDTLFITPQISVDGLTWVSVDTLGAGLTSANITTLASAGAQTQTFHTTMGGIGAKRINWDRAAANFLRFIVRKDTNSPGAVVELSVAGKKN
jgi:hypothetical protein